MQFHKIECSSMSMHAISWACCSSIQLNFSLSEQLTRTSQCLFYLLYLKILYVFVYSPSSPSIPQVASPCYNPKLVWDPLITGLWSFLSPYIFQDQFGSKADHFELSPENCYKQVCQNHQFFAPKYFAGHLQKNKMEWKQMVRHFCPFVQYVQDGW